ncbi:MAG: acetate--CoA ligase family protein [Smithellaceae bacterium]|nr:acetate--CoA ligase family protein [Smithellaceae bacterium]
MDVENLLKKKKAGKRVALTEAQSKELLKHYGVPVVEEVVVTSVEDAVSQAGTMGYPLVVKGLGEKLTHKTERGLVKLNLQTAEAVRSAAEEIRAAAGDDLEGFLLQPMLKGRREFVVGLFRDEQFGPVVMFGLGGVFTEALDDVAFRLAPLSDSQAAQMLTELRATKLLGPFRGEAAADEQQLIKTLVGISRLGNEHAEVAEVDVNPLLITPDGKVAAVDALVILADKKVSKDVRAPIEPKAIRNLFYPRSIAFIGASPRFAKWGQMLYSNVIGANYKGDIYLVNPKGGTIAERPVFKSVTDIPGPVDLAVVTIPAAQVLDLIPGLKAKCIKNMLLISSGFSETGKEGRELEAKLVSVARDNGIVILGPNTMGICNPHISLYCMGSHVHPKPGSTALVAQSGNLGVQLLGFAEKEGIGIRAFSGSGNEAMISIEDYMDGFEVDDLTDTVLLYIESVKNGRRFYESARRVGRKKPVVILKGGRTQAGNRAAASHTGALASNIRVFEAACRQAGVVLAEHPMDLLDLSAVFSSLPLPLGKRVAIMTLGGGWGVVTADMCIEHGLQIPDLSPDIIARMDKILPPYWSRSNPIDIVGENDPQIPLAVMEELIQWDGCDAVIHMGILGRIPFVKAMIASTLASDPTADRAFLSKIPGYMKQFDDGYMEKVIRLMGEHEKPVLGVYLLADENSRTIHEIEGARYKGVSFLTPERAVKALAKMASYKNWLDQETASH